MRAGGRRTAGFLAALALIVGACGGSDDDGADGGTAQDLVPAEQTGGDDGVSGGTGPANDDEQADNGTGEAEPGEVVAWNVALSGAIDAALQKGELGDPVITLSTSRCNNLDWQVSQPPSMTPLYAFRVIFDAEMTDGLTGTFPTTELTVFDMDEDQPGVEQARYTGQGQVEVIAYEGGNPEERRLTVRVAGSATSDAGDTVDVEIHYDWRDSCDRA